MAFFSTAASDGNTPVLHSRKVFRNSLDQTTVRSWYGAKGSGKPIILDTTLKAQPGETVRFHFTPFTGNNPIRGQAAGILGNENAISEYNFPLTIDEVKWGLRREGRMTEQRSILNTRNEHTIQLTNQLREFNTDQTFRVLSGYTNETDTAVGDARVNGSGRCIESTGTGTVPTPVAAGGSDETALNTSIAATDVMTVRLIEDAVIMARGQDTRTNGFGTYRINPISVGPNFTPMYLAYLSLPCARDLKDDARFESFWLALVESGMADDPIATGALGKIGNVLVFETERVYTFGSSGDGVARNLLIGADAMVQGYALTSDYTEEVLDHKRVLSSGVTEHRGEAKVTLEIAGGTSEDAGVIQMIAASN